MKRLSRNPPPLLGWTPLFFLALLLLLLTGCETSDPTPSAASANPNLPRSILVLPPVNESIDVHASESVLSQVTVPVAESGYYVFPVALAFETFVQNGFSEAALIHQIDPARLQEIFGADAALYLLVEEFGTSYKVLSSVTRVTIRGRLVDLRNGRILWEGKSSAGSSSGGDNIASALIGSVVGQVLDTLTEESHSIAGEATFRLLYWQNPRALPRGHRAFR